MCHINNTDNTSTVSRPSRTYGENVVTVNMVEIYSMVLGRARGARLRRCNHDEGVCVIGGSAPRPLTKSQSYRYFFFFLTFIPILGSHSEIRG